MPASRRPRPFVRALAAGRDRTTRIGAWAVLPLALLLFAQWPLREQQSLLIAVLVAWPGLTHWGANESGRTGVPVMSNDEAEKVIEEAARRDSRGAAPEVPATSEPSRLVSRRRSRGGFSRRFLFCL